MKKKILIADADEQFSTELMAALQACDMSALPRMVNRQFKGLCISGRTYWYWICC